MNLTPTPDPRPDRTGTLSEPSRHEAGQRVAPVPSQAGGSNADEIASSVAAGAPAFAALPAPDGDDPSQQVDPAPAQVTDLDPTKEAEPCPT